MNPTRYSTKMQQQKTEFWSDATQYVTSVQDDPFLNEIAYMMVTLHCTGA